MALTIGNPLKSTAAAAITTNNTNVNVKGKEISTGRKNASVVEQYLGSGLKQNSYVLSKINSSMNYSINALKVAQNSLVKIADTLKAAKGTIVQSSGISVENKGKLNDTLAKQVSFIENQLKATEFDGKKLLTGGMGGDASLIAKFNNTTTSVTQSGVHARFGLAIAAVNTITVANGAVVNDTITIEGQVFTLVAGEPAKEGEVKVGGTDAETAKNLALAINNSTNEALKKLGVTVNNGGVVTLTDKTASGKPLTIVGHANMANAIATAGVKGGIDVSNIRDIRALKGFGQATFTAVSYAGAAAQEIAISHNIVPGAVVNAGDRAARITVKIGDKDFVGVAFHVNAANIQGQVISFKHAATGESFDITMIAGVGAGDIANQVSANGLATSMTALWKDANFAQSKVLDIKTDKGNVLSPDGTRIASLKGMTANITTKTGIADKKFTDFTIEDVGAGSVRFTAKVSTSTGESVFTVTKTQAQVAQLHQGSLLELTDAATGDVMAINVGEGGLTSLGEVKNHAKIADVFKDAFVKPGLSVRVGLAMDDNVIVNVNDLSMNKLLRDKNGASFAKLSVIDKADADKAEEVLDRSIDFVLAEIASIQTQIESLSSSSESIQSRIDISEDAASKFLDTDVVEASQEFAESVHNVVNNIATLAAGNKISDAIQSLIQNISR